MLQLGVPFAAGLLALSVVVAPSVHAQEVSPDFAGQVETTLPSNEQLLGQIQDTIPGEDLVAISDQTGPILVIGENLLQQLSTARGMAPDDVSRSRLEGVLNHTQATVDALRTVQSETTLESARGRLDQARGEAQESLDELRPFVLGLVATGEITGK